MASELLPCAHCNSAAELDYEQPFCAFPSGKMEKQVAIYCNACDVHMSMCYSDFPEYDHDQMAAILTEKWNTRPAPVATDTGLETVGYWLTGHTAITTSKKEWSSWKLDPYTDELVTRSQAEKLLAAERAEKDGWKELHDAAQVAVKERTEACNNLYKQVNDLKADNAAKDARINFLERVTKDQETQITAQEVLEAKLASAEKALEGLREKGRKVLDVLKAWEDDSDLINSGEIVADFRALLGGKS
nr:hypothetical protein [Brucella intermedia]